MNMQKLAVVVWKNLLVRRRRWLLTLLEIIVPSAIFMAIALAHSVEYNRVELERNNNTLHGTTILFTPRNWFTARMMRHVEKTLHVGVKSFRNEKLLMNFYTLLDRERWHTYGVVFEGLPSGGGIPQNLTYKICVNQEETEFIVPRVRNEEAAYWLRNIPDVSLHPHFVAIQMALDRAFINMTRPNHRSPKLILQQELSPGVVQVTSSAGDKLLEVMLVLSMTVLSVSVVMKLVHEKESGIKELMKIMGMPSWMVLVGWMLDFLLVNMMTMTIVTTCLVTRWNEVSPVIANVDVSLLWTFLALYGAASITFCFLLSSFFSQTKVAVCFGVVLWCLSYFLPQKMAYGSVMRLLSCMLPNMAMSWGFTIIFTLQEQGAHVTWRNILTPAGNITGDMCLACVFSMLFADIVLFTLATLYFEAVWPNKYGASRPWYFIFIPSCWTGTRSLSGNKGVSAGIKMQDLGKVFTSFCRLHKRVAVDGITADICKGDITVLLGLNGSGKSTIVSIVTGVMHPTSGAVYVDGYDIRERPPEGVGVCFQQNLYFPELTVLQHLIFFAVLKGVPIVRAREEAYSYIIKLRLVDKGNKLVSELSVGQRRKLAIGIAVVGNPKILVLDEPTLGMDPEAKREVWDLLLGLRGLHQTTLVTTHDAEEADVLGDRVAILDHGRVQCYGTASYLKKIYGNSFKLTLMRKQGVTQLQDTVQQCVLGAKCYTDKSCMQAFSLPAECSAQFPELFDQLELNRQALGIESIGIASTTLEDVLLRVGKTLEDEQNVPKSPDSMDTATVVDSSDEFELKKKMGTELHMMHLTALFIKKTIFTCRNWLHFLLHVLLITLTIVPLIVTLDVNYYPRLQFPRLLSLKDYGPVEVLCEAQPGADMALVNKYKSLVMSNSSEGLFVNSSVPTEAFIAVEFSKNTVNMLCTQETAGVAVNLVSNAILLPQHSITVMSQPFSKHKKPGKLLDMIPEVGPLVLLPLCLQFVVQSCLIFPLLERVSGVKHLQQMTGVKPIVYWAACFTVDLLLYLTICIIVVEVLALAGSSVHLIMGLRDLCPYLLLFFLFACAGIPYTYLLSHRNKMASYSASVICLLNICQGLVIPVALFIIKSSSSSEYAFIGAFVRYLFEFFPPCTFMLGYISLMDQYYSNSRCRMFHSMKFPCVSSLHLQDICCCEGANCQKSYLGFPSKGNPRGIGEELVFLTVDIVLYWALLLLADSMLLYRLRRKMLHQTSRQAQVLDIDVMKEQEQIKTKVNGLPLQPNEDDLLVYKLMKKYYDMNVPAVKGVSFSIGPGQCFGLLGVNGAGKTSMLRMIVGQDCPNDGDVWVTQWKLSSGDVEYYSQLGYCPEADSFNEHLTGREMLQLFTRLRGIPGEWERNHEVNKWLIYAGLHEVANQQCSTYSSSNRRKLNFALAGIGEPRLIILDDPTNGIDVVAKRNIWNVVAVLRNSGQSVLITTHSMAECEALCTRIGMMVSGQLVCLGDLAHIRKTFGQGIIIIIKLRLLGTDELQVTKLKEAFEEYLRPNCVLRSERQGYLHYHVLELNTSWKLLFTFMEHIKHDHNIVEHYSISETPRLDDAFLSFAKIEPRYIDDITSI